MASRFPCRVDEQGRLIPAYPERMLRLRGKEVWVEVHKAAGAVQRSDQANKYLWGVCYAEIARATGSDPDSVHYGLKREAVRIGVLEPQYILLGDKLIEDEPTTRTDSETFTKYVNWLKHFAFHDLGGIVIPDCEDAA